MAAVGQLLCTSHVGEFRKFGALAVTRPAAYNIRTQLISFPSYLIAFTSNELELDIRLLLDLGFGPRGLKKLKGVVVHVASTILVFTAKPIPYIGMLLQLFLILASLPSLLQTSHIVAPPSSTFGLFLRTSLHTIISLDGLMSNILGPQLSSPPPSALWPPPSFPNFVYWPFAILQLLEPFQAKSQSLTFGHSSNPRLSQKRMLPSDDRRFLYVP